MDVVGSEIGQKMRSAIKAKLTELGCYVDDELPDYVMVMVANKRTRSQMEEDLQLFLGDNTELFVNWLHQVLKKLQEVTVTTPLKTAEPETIKEKTKERKYKDKKDKSKIKKKTDGVKKAKKKDKEKSSKKKDEKKAHKSKKKSKHHGMIRPNVPPLLMNMEKVSEPSITDVFAGQILKNHGITIETINSKEEFKIDVKPVIEEIKRPILPIIDPATITSQSEPASTNVQSISEIESTSEIQSISEVQSTSEVQSPDEDQSFSNKTKDVRKTSVSSVGAPREEQIKEMTEIEIKIQGLKQKLADQLDSMSDDEDFLNIRTEAEELMNDFAEDVFQEISSQAPVETPTTTRKSPSPSPPSPKPIEPPKEPETLPQIELKLPKRPIRERLGAREETKQVPEISKEEPEIAKKVPEVTTKVPEVTKKASERKAKKVDKRTESPERFTPEREPDFWPKNRSARSRLGEPPEPAKRVVVAETPADQSDSVSKRLISKVSTLESRPRAKCASVVRVRPRPRVAAPASSLLLRAVADAHKSLLNIPPKVDAEPHQVKRAMVLPMRRNVDQKILIHVPGKERCGPAGDGAGHNVDADVDDKSSKVPSYIDQVEYTSASFSKTIQNTEYVPCRSSERTSSRQDDTLIIETINIHNTTVDKDKKTQFIVTMDGFNPNCFLTKKLMTEGLLDEEEGNEIPETTKSVLKTTESVLKTNNLELKTTEPVPKTKEPVLKTKELVLKTTDQIAKATKPVQNELENPEEMETDMNNETARKFKANDDLKASSVKKKRSSNSSEETDTEVVIKQEDRKLEKRKPKETSISEATIDNTDSLPVKKRRASPIVFDVKKETVLVKKKERQRTESASSDNHVIVTTPTDMHKYDTLPPLSQAERKATWCRSFPSCRYGGACAFQHPRCKFAAACTRRGCVYAHGPTRAAVPPPPIASHVVPSANFKSITASALPAVCKYYPGCVNPACHYYHPKPCRYGAACANRLECNFYHSDAPANWRYPV